MCAESQKTLDAMQHRVVCLTDAVSYSVTRANDTSLPNWLTSRMRLLRRQIGNCQPQGMQWKESGSPVLAPRMTSRAMDALRFSLASDIVELVVLTADEHLPANAARSRGTGAAALARPVLGQDQRSSGRGRRRHPGARRASAARDGPRGSSPTSSASFPISSSWWPASAKPKRSSRRLISDGTVYRFIHKPMSPARARLFADAAVKRYDDQQRNVEATVAAVTAPRSGG